MACVLFEMLKETIFNLKLCLINILTISHNSITLTRPRRVTTIPRPKNKTTLTLEVLRMLGQPLAP